MSTITKQNLKDSILIDFITKWDHNKQIGGFFSRKISLPAGFILTYTVMLHTPDMVTPYFTAFYIEAQVEKDNSYERFDLSKEMRDTINAYLDDPDLISEIDFCFKMKSFTKMPETVKAFITPEQLN